MCESVSLTPTLDPLQLPDLPVALRQAVGLGAGGDGVAEVNVDRNARNRFKPRLHAKGLGSPRHHGVAAGVAGGIGEINRRISDLKVEAGSTPASPGSPHIMDLHARLAPPGTTNTASTTVPDNRRDSNSTVSTYYGSMRSADLGSSRRSSGVSYAGLVKTTVPPAVSLSSYDCFVLTATCVRRCLPSRHISPGRTWRRRARCTTPSRRAARVGPRSRARRVRRSPPGTATGWAPTATGRKARTPPTTISSPPPTSCCR